MIALYIMAFCRMVIGLVFAISSGSKVFRLQAFRQTIFRFHLFPARFIAPAAMLFLSSEMAVVILLALGGQALLPGFVLAIFLLILFSGALLSVVIRGFSTSCNCFGPDQRTISSADIWRNAGFLLCALVGCAGVIWSPKIVEDPGNIEWMFAGLGALVFVLIWTQLGELAQLFHRG